jgi:hypothetical protein
VGTEQYRVDKSLPLVTGGLAVAYFIGFLVANGYYGRLQILDYGAFRLHYLVAAILFVTTVAVPFAAFSLMKREFASRWQGGPGQRRLPLAILHWSFLLLGVLLSWLAVMNVIAVGGAAAWWRDSAIFIVGTAAVWYLLLYVVAPAIQQGSRRGWPTLNMPDLHLLVMTAGALISFAAAYGALIYPYARPTLGGGAAWIVEVPQADPTFAALLGVDLSRVAVVSRDDGALRFAACSAREGKRGGSVDRGAPLGNLLTVDPARAPSGVCP